MASPPLTELADDPIALTRALVDIESVSGEEKQITDAVELALREAGHLSVQRVGNVVRAATNLGRGQRVILAGHLDTVPPHGNLPSTQDGDRLYGCGTSDMKSGAALALHLALTLPEPDHDVTYLFYDCEEIEAERNGLAVIGRTHPEWLAGDFAVLLEPTHGLVEAGCQGTLRVRLAVGGRRAHAARAWKGVNAIHGAAPVLAVLADYRPRRPIIDECEYHEGLNAVGICGGVAGNVIPDRCEIDINHRFAPDRTPDEAIAHLRELFAGHELEIVDVAPGARPGLTNPVAREFVAAVGAPAVAKLGWTDVARFAALGIPALNYGPGDPSLAHSPDEHVELAKITQGAAVLRRWLTG
ncbi:MAG TPA: succinyl-diaminopimelate desuccinylase [Micromonosporaceae bacterium]|jgi:succinyl-diaminopimelate desuccinylase